MGDAERLQMLGGGLAAQAANAKTLRAKNLAQAIDASAGAASAPQPAGPPPGDQQRFSRPWTPQERMIQQQKLAEMLRARR